MKQLYGTERAKESDEQDYKLQTTSEKEATKI